MKSDYTLSGKIMQKIQDYTILEQITETRSSIIYRGRKDTSDSTVIIKALKTKNPTPSEIARFRQEYKLIKDLNIEGVIKILDLLEHKDGLALVLEDFNSVSLKSLLEDIKKFELKQFLNISIKIADALGSLHEKQIVHRDIKPNNILINVKTWNVKITDFGISSELTHENDEIYNPDVIEGSLAYMSPEQTGRMNRTVDYRTDIYSLGISFYEMLTGYLPFLSDDPMAIIHSHIALMPVPPKKHNGAIPHIISDIVMKLLSKNKKDRYQNSFGLMADLNECLKQLTETDTIESFKLGMFDISDRFIIPQKLFGRENEIHTLISGFEELCNASETSADREDHRGVKIMLVAGHSGIGKSSLISEIHKPIVASRGYFISGEYEQFRTNKPYNILIQALQGLVKQILAESNEKISIWKEKIQKALGPNGRVIIDFIPEIEHIIGKQPELVELDPVESKNRFNYVFEKFASVFPSAEHPVVLFIDNLQWADLQSIELIQNLVLSGNLRYLYVIGAYRSDEVDMSHPLADLAGKIKKAGVDVRWINLEPISSNDIKNLIVNFLKCPVDKGKQLSDLVFNKTGGNPFFVIQFLKTFYNEKLIKLDVEHGWEWDIQKINQLQITDNVVELMVGKINRLPDNTREVLKICAAIGNSFDLETLSFILEKSIDEVLDSLTETINEGLVSLSSGKEFYMFHHDRIQEAAYSLVADHQKPALHYRIGRKALERASTEDDLDKRLFYIVDQLNLGAELITTVKERDELARLNLKAGIKAMATSAFSPAIRYLETGIELLGDGCWEKKYELTLSFYKEITEAAYLNGDYDKTNELANIALQHTKTILDKVNIVISRINACRAQEDYQGSINAALPILKLLGIRIPKKPTRLHLAIELLKMKLALKGKKPADLLNLPEMTNPKLKAIGQILAVMGYTAFFVNPNLLACIVLKGAVLSIRHGHIPESAFGYAGYGVVLAAGLRDYDGALEFGDLGLKLIDKLGDRKQLSKIIFVYNVIIKHWKASLKDTIASLLEGYRVGLETGDFDFAAFNLQLGDVHSFFRGKELSEIENDLARHNRIIKGFNQKYILTLNSITWQIVLNLLDQCEDPLKLTGNAIKGEDLLPLWTQENNRAVLSIFYVARLSLCIFYNNYSRALEDSIMYKKYMDEMQGVVINLFAFFYDSISRLLLFPDVSPLKKIKYRMQVKFNQIQMKRWADNAPVNYLQIFYTVEALRSWILRKDIDRAKKEFDQASRSCKRPDDIIIEAIINELLVSLYISIGDKKKANEYMIATYNRYSSWGALGKLKQLREKYPEIVDLMKENKTVDENSTATGTGTIARALDLSTAMKASQTISGEVVLEKLLVKMIELTMENAGADRGFMLLVEKGTLLVEAEKTVGSNNVTVLESIPLDTHRGLSSNIVNYVARTKETLILNDAASEGNFTRDFYIKLNRPKSILCIPILHQNKLLGVLYLENNLSTGAFTSERLEMLNVISSQIAISIDNAKLYENLEEKVRERTEELEKAHRIAQMDMDMAINVQTSLFPKTPPNTPGWDVAFTFKPMSGVSGDLYDFYESDGTLSGITLLDVSGHGIASGLITMIARSVFDRNFRKGKHEELNQVMVMANKDLINEIGNVDNYLTGILLRFREDTVEYVNAAHVDLICKKAATKKAEIIRSANRKFKGGFLGVEGFDMPYEVLTFDIAQDDTILLYSDGLNESKNSDGEEYGDERIISSFENAPDGSAESVMEFVLNDFYTFVGDRPASDDLTVIVVKKVNS